MRRLMSALSVLALGLGLLGCATAPMAVPERDQQAKTFAPVAGKAVLYVFRDETMGAAIKMDVQIDGQKIAETVAHSFLRLELAPGEHAVLSKAENDSTLKLSMEAGKVYFVWQEVKMGIMIMRSKLQEVPAEDGRKRVQTCSLLEAPTSFPSK